MIQNAVNQISIKSRCFIIVLKIFSIITRAILVSWFSSDTERASLLPRFGFYKNPQFQYYSMYLVQRMKTTVNHPLLYQQSVGIEISIGRNAKK
jgi:hypothetical protein